KIKYTNKIVPVFHDKNMGKGAAIRTAIDKMTGDICIIQDADLEYDPSDYPILLEPLVDTRADCVYGSRFVGSQSKRVLFFWHYLGNKFLTLLSNMFTNLNLTDIETCYKAFRCDVLKSIPLQCNRFGFEPEITAKISKKRCRIFEVGISYSGRTYDEGKKITWKDGIKAMFLIIKYGVICNIDKR
ncbi:MAG: glycosyltransferase family 2 protein, partial [Candidatus Omnitrophica bacterium]|nr:glycosyltransferase family 2 protein [Candidatus Omnitrophota bacterium]